MNQKKTPSAALKLLRTEISHSDDPSLNDKPLTRLAAKLSQLADSLEKLADSPDGFYQTNNSKQTSSADFHGIPSYLNLKKLASVDENQGSSKMKTESYLRLVD